MFAPSILTHLPSYIVNHLKNDKIGSGAGRPTAHSAQPAKTARRFVELQLTSVGVGQR